jgi:hypothetical protein
MRYEDFNKQLVQLYKEERALYQQQRNLGWVPLYPPVQKGWKRFFVLRDDVAKGRQAEFFQNILNKINRYDWNYRKDFKVKKRKWGKKIYVVKPQKLLEPCQQHFVKVGFNEDEKALFHEVWSSHKQRPYMKRYVFNEPWRFAIRVKANMIDKVKKRDEVIEARLKWIAYYLERNDYRKTQSRLLHGHYQWNRWKEFEKHNEVNPFENKPIEEILGEINVLYIFLTPLGDGAKACLTARLAYTCCQQTRFMF